MCIYVYVRNYAYAYADTCVYANVSDLYFLWNSKLVPTWFIEHLSFDSQIFQAQRTNEPTNLRKKLRIEGRAPATLFKATCMQKRRQK